MRVRLECCTHAQHIGEAQPIRADGICEHPFLVPNSARTECILPGRIDIGRHYILSGGTEGLKEEYESLVSRVQSFGVYLWDLQAHPVIQQLFASDTFTRAAGEVCPPHKQLLDPFQVRFGSSWIGAPHARCLLSDDGTSCMIAHVGALVCCPPAVQSDRQLAWTNCCHAH